MGRSSEDADYVAQSRWRNQPAIVNKPKNLTLGGPKFGLSAQAKNVTPGGPKFGLSAKRRRLV